MVALWAPQMLKSLFPRYFFTDRAGVRGHYSIQNRGFPPDGCYRCEFSTLCTISALGLLSVANVGYIAKLGEMGVFFLGN
jgi:hypothetical protein